MPHTIFEVERNNCRRWSLIAVSGGRRTLVDETSTTGRKRAVIEFERKHRIVVERLDGDPTDAGLLREAKRLSLDLSGVKAAD